MWIFNVGDIKPNEFLTEYGLDLAWSGETLREKDYSRYLLAWLQREFGAATAEKALPIMTEYYDLSYRRRAEMLGNTRVEEADKGYMKPSDLPWTDDEAAHFLARAEVMAAAADSLEATIPIEKRPAFFELVAYPCRSYAAMARKMLGSQLARHGKIGWEKALEDHNEVYALTRQYHEMLGGKWNKMMGFWNRHSMFLPVDTAKACAPYTPEWERIGTITALDGAMGHKAQTLPRLGYSGHALAMAVGEPFAASLPPSADTLLLQMAFVPNHPEDAGNLEVRVEIDGLPATVLTYNTAGRSEEWKQNIERNQAIRSLALPPSGAQRQLKITATRRQ